ncbi:hypothetical protein [Shewanella surugensis]|uniref:Uncharacterized protein n=1 Tax=Shewanella surugensis TaxID=212020 RepID=A0ABT0LJC2_9GAMM|nr:hypothetical protein [Shewanella surugensis]MCL1127788.1 hypothetical protein [Shewanella surugensis]
MAVSLPFVSKIDDARINSMLDLEKSEICHISIWDQIKDFFRSNTMYDALNELYDIIHGCDNQNTLEMFNSLKSCAGSAFVDRFGFRPDYDIYGNITFTINDVVIKSEKFCDVVKQIKDRNGEPLLFNFVEEAYLFCMDNKADFMSKHLNSGGEPINLDAIGGDESPIDGDDKMAVCEYFMRNSEQGKQISELFYSVNTTGNLFYFDQFNMSDLRESNIYHMNLAYEYVKSHP